MLCFSSFLPRSCEPLGKSLFKSLGKVLTVDFIYHASLPHPPGFPTWDLQSPEVLKNQQRGRGRGRGPNLIAVSDFQYYKTMPSGKGTLSSDKAIQVKPSTCLWNGLCELKGHLYSANETFFTAFFAQQNNKQINTNQKMGWAVKYYLKKNNWYTKISKFGSHQEKNDKLALKRLASTGVSKLLPLV